LFDLLHVGAAWVVVAGFFGEYVFLAMLSAAFTAIPY
jgi:hypothetical protein